ncbi:MAG: glycosyltransferase family 4 protein [Anaerolineae bacterium]
MRVLILSQYYDPEPVQKPGELARELSKRGHQVSVLTGWPNYPSGRLYPGYKLAAFRRETVDGVPVLRAYELPYHGRKVIGRLANYVSFMLSACAAALLVPCADVMYVWHPPLTIGVAAAVIALLRRIPFVYDVQDIWPESAVLAGVLSDGPMVKVMSTLEHFVYRRAAHILVVTEGARANLIEKGVPADKVSVMAHWVDEALFTAEHGDGRDAIRESLGWQAHFVIVFAGNIGLVQGLDTVVDAASRLTPGTPVLVSIVGDGADRERLQRRVHELGLERRVRFIDRQPLDRMPALFAAADALLVHLRKAKLSHYVIPTKTLAYLAACRPVLMAMDGAAADMVAEAGAGVIVEPENADALARAMEALASMAPVEREAMGRSGREYLVSRLSKERVIPSYERVLARFARRSGR